jgi:hypothetical protein
LFLKADFRQNEPTGKPFALAKAPKTTRTLTSQSNEPMFHSGLALLRVNLIRNCAGFDQPT